MALTISQRLAGFIALATSAAGLAEAAFWWSRSAPDPWVLLVGWFHGLVLVIAALGSAMGWLLQWKGPLWSVAFGRGLVAATAFVVLMWTAFLPADFWR